MLEYKKEAFPEFGTTHLNYITKQNEFINNNEPYYEMHINIDPAFQGQGVARKIILAFSKTAEYPLFFSKPRIVNPNLIKTLEKMESLPNVKKDEYGWYITKR